MCRVISTNVGEHDLFYTLDLLFGAMDLVGAGVGEMLLRRRERTIKRRMSARSTRHATPRPYDSQLHVP
jgi:hypothetical protein